MTQWFHFTCGRCGRNEYAGADDRNGIVCTDVCSCGEPIIGGIYRIDDLGIGHMVFEKEPTPALDRAKDANYGPRDSNGCCWHCEHFRIQEYAPSGKKCVCDELNIQVLKGHGCRLFRWRKRDE